MEPMLETPPQPQTQPGPPGQPSAPPVAETPLPVPPAAPIVPTPPSSMNPVVAFAGIVGLCVLLVGGSLVVNAINKQQQERAETEATTEDQAEDTSVEDEKVAPEDLPRIPREQATLAVQGRVTAYATALKQQEAATIFGFLTPEEQAVHPVDTLTTALRTSGVVINDAVIVGGITFQNLRNDFILKTGMDHEEAKKEQELNLYLPDDGYLEATIPLNITYRMPNGISSEASVKIQAQYINEEWLLTYAGPSRYVAVNQAFTKEKIEEQAAYNGTVSGFSGTVKDVIVLQGINETWVNFDLVNTSIYKTQPGLENLWALLIPCQLSCHNVMSDDFGTKASVDRFALLGGKTSFAIGENGAGYVVFGAAPNPKAQSMFVTLEFKVGPSFAADVETGALEL